MKGIQPKIENEVLPGSLVEEVPTFRDAARAILRRYATFEAATEQSENTEPDVLIDGIDDFLKIVLRIQKDASAGKRLSAHDISQMSDYAVSLLQDLMTWASDLDLKDVYQELERFMVALVFWVIDQEAEILSLEPVINAVANLANRLDKPEDLAELVASMHDLVLAVSDENKVESDTGKTAWPWRILLINRAIVATRSHDTQHMEQAFDELVHYLPEEAATFFTEGMQQMEVLKYPPHVGEFMQRYFDRFTRHQMH